MSLYKKVLDAGFSESPYWFTHTDEVDSELTTCNVKPSSII